MSLSPKQIAMNKTDREHILVAKKIEAILFWYKLEAKKCLHDQARCVLLKDMAKRCIGYEEYEMADVLIHKRIALLQSIRKRRFQSNFKYKCHRGWIHFKYFVRALRHASGSHPIL